MTLEEKIHNLQDKISEEICLINCGGCIHFAYYFSRRLKELNIEHKIAFMDDYNIRLEYKNFEPVRHVMVYIPNIGLIDGTSIKKKNSFVRGTYYFKITDCSLKKLDNFRRLFKWNFQYDQKNNEKLDKLIKKFIYE